MSLLDAVLLEGYRDPREIYIALRSDGQRGSGNIDDPYDGGTRLGPSLAATLTCNRREFAVALLGHGLIPGDTVAIRNVQGPSAARFNVTAQVYRVLSPAHFTVLAIGSSTDPPPFPPAVQYYPDVIQVARHGAAPVASDPWVRLYWPVAIVTLPSGHGLGILDAVTIGGTGLPAGYAGEHPILGPNTPATGNDFAYRLGFLPSADVTTAIGCTVTRIAHRFDETMRAVPLNSVIHVGPGTFETRGFASTHVADVLDYSKLFTGYILRDGQRLLGSGIGVTTLKLVLPHDEVTETAAVANPSSPSASGSEVADLTVDCNASGHTAPYLIFPAPVSCSAVSLGGSFIRVHRVRGVNFCDQAFPENFPIGVREGTDVPVAVFNIIENCILERPGLNNTHETTLLSSVGGHRAQGRSPIARHNYADCTYVRSGSDVFSSEYVAVQSITQHSDPNWDLFTLVTKKPHHRTGPDAQDRFTSNLHFTGITSASQPLTHPLIVNVNRSFPVVAIDSTNPETKLVFKLPGLTGAVDSFDATKAYIGVDFHGPHAASGTGCVTEGNATYDCWNAYYSDTGATRDAVVRDNYYSDIGQAVNLSYAGGPGSEDPRSAVSLKRDPSNHKIAILEFATAHGLFVGQVVTITGALIGNPPNPNNPYNGNHRIIAVSADANAVVRYFRYEMKEVPNPDEDAAPATGGILFRFSWQNPRHVFENNCYDLYPYDLNSALPSYGIGTYAYVPLPPFTVPASPPYTFPGVVIRENVFRLRDGARGQAVNGNEGWACRLDNFENTLVEHNVIDSRFPFPVHHLNSQSVTAFNNRSSAGMHLPVYNDTSGSGVLSSFRKEDSLEDKVQDALIASLL